ncbi:hypothetical protein [Flavobacterium columnare]|uniref:hypothetical protein n=1 Tax=Flavobacterium columnare TaxID=996 RepID=UPI0018964904|nr:hypothetical protein [Flavobacterium columnare]MBF6654156.1 hypothetical protein [Flavobacterium columnare]MBF6657449.1 hypothetical protein [Flavobacterium columnare]
MANILLNKIKVEEKKEDVKLFTLFIINNTKENIFSHLDLEFEVSNINDNCIFIYSRHINATDKVEKLSLIFPELVFYCVSATYEDVRALFVFKEVIKEGKIIEKNYPLDESIEAYEIFFEVYPDSKVDYVFKNGNYIYNGWK